MRTDSLTSPIRKATVRRVSDGESMGAERYPLWLWWNLLSLDAPTIVCLWALLFLHVSKVECPGWEIVALVSTVWIIYAGDRILDGLRKPASVVLSERHRFYSRHLGVIVTLLLMMFLAAGWISLDRLGGQIRFAGLIMSTAVLFYFLAIHAVPERAGRWFPKEIAVGAIFAVGAALPAWIHGTESRNLLLPETLAFGGVCMLNCVAIECWENNRGERRWVEAPYWLIRVADTRIAQIAVILFLSSVGIGIFVARSGNSTELLGACSISLLATIVMERQSNAVSRQSLRVLADAALLSPLVFLLRWVH